MKKTALRSLDLNEYTEVEAEKKNNLEKSRKLSVGKNRFVKSYQIWSIRI